MFKRAVISEFLRFAAIGALATVIHYAALILLVEVAHEPLIPSTSAGFTLGAVVSYSLNRRITFRHQPHFGRGLVKFVSLGSVGLGLNALIVAAFVHAGVQYILAQMTATGTILLWNFLVSRLLIFAPQRAAN
jgi:putative flippase GtrA